MAVRKISHLDDIDQKIIDVLIENPEFNMAQISDKINVPKTTVYNRYSKLREEKIIRPGLKIDKNFLYGDIVTFILIQIVGEDQKIILEKLMKMTEVEEAAIVTGENDMILRLRLKKIQDLNTFILEKLRKIKGIANSTSMIGLEYRNKFDDM